MYFYHFAVLISNLPKGKWLPKMKSWKSKSGEIKINGKSLGDGVLGVWESIGW